MYWNNPFTDIVLTITWPITWFFLLRTMLRGDMKRRAERKGNA